jgi:glycosyltransferase involved in cell wall biosynthesis
MKIAVVSSLFAPFGIGGAEQVAAEIAEGLHQDGHEVDVISTARRRDLQGAAYRIDEWNGLRVWRIAPWNLYWRFDRETDHPPGRLRRAAWHAVDLCNPTVMGPLAEVLRRIQPDVINTHTIDGLSPLAWQVARRFSPVVHTLHDYHLLCPRAVMQRRDGSFCAELCGGCSVYTSYYHLYQRYVDALISPSNIVADLHRSGGWTTPKMVVVRNAISANEEPLPATSSTGPLQVVFMSRLVREKGCETLIQTMERFRGRKDHVQFHIAGEGPYAARLAHMAAENSHITWHGYVKGKEKATLLSGVDVFLQLSEWRENAPLSLLEAKQFGNYILATRIGGLPELITTPLDGELIPPGDPSSLAAAIETQITNRDKIRDLRLMRASASLGYGIPEMCRQYSQVFADVCHPQAGSNTHEPEATPAMTPPDSESLGT